MHCTVILTLEPQNKASSGLVLGPFSVYSDIDLKESFWGMGRNGDISFPGGLSPFLKATAEAVAQIIYFTRITRKTEILPSY